MLRSQLIFTTPKDRDFPAIKARGVTAAWDGVRRFPEGCTDTSSPTSASFTIFENQPHHSSALLTDFHSSYSSTDLLHAAENRFGPGSRRQWLFGPHEEEATEEGTKGEFCWDWEVNINQISLFVQFLSQSEPLAKHWIGPAELTVFFDFHWVEPRSKRLLPYQNPIYYSHESQADSRAMISLSRRSSISVHANFPFAAVDEHFLSYCDQIAPLLPARLPAKHFRLFVPNKRGDGYVTKKLDPDQVSKIERHFL